MTSESEEVLNICLQKQRMQPSPINPTTAESDRSDGHSAPRQAPSQKRKLQKAATSKQFIPNHCCMQSKRDLPSQQFHLLFGISRDTLLRGRTSQQDALWRPSTQKNFKEAHLLSAKCKYSSYSFRPFVSTTNLEVEPFLCTRTVSRTTNRPVTSTVIETVGEQVPN